MHFDPLPVVACPWTEAGEAAEIAAADVGISWIPDDDWSRGKCGLKVLQYMAAGLPVVANPVGVHAEMIRHGETGFLAETTEQWVDGRRPAGARPGTATADGRAGRRLLEEKYTRRARRRALAASARRAWARRKAGGMIQTSPSSSRPAERPGKRRRN